MIASKYRTGRRPRNRHIERLEARQMLAIDFTGFTPIAPLGSGAYRASATGTVAAGVAESGSFEIMSGAQFSINLDADASLSPSLRLTGPAGSFDLPTIAGSDPPQIVTGSIRIVEGGVYTLDLTGRNNTSGDYTLDVMINSVFEAESVVADLSNDSPHLAQSLSAFDFATLGAAAATTTIVGQTEPFTANTATTEDFEDGIPSDPWQYYSSDGSGSISVGNELGAAQGDLALELTTSPLVPPTASELRPDEVRLDYDPTTGELLLRTDRPWTTIEITSKSGAFQGRRPRYHRWRLRHL